SRVVRLRSLVAGLRDVCARRHVIDKPDIAPDGASLAQGDAPQDCGARVDDDVVFHDRVTRQALGERAVGVCREALGTQGDRLVDTHVIADDGRFTYHDAGAVVDEEGFAGGRSEE